LYGENPRVAVVRTAVCSRKLGGGGGRTRGDLQIYAKEILRSRAGASRAQGLGTTQDVNVGDWLPGGVSNTRYDRREQGEVKFNDIYVVPEVWRRGTWLNQL